MTGVILLVWIGWGNTQALAVDHFATMEECMLASAALAKEDKRLEGKCLPYGEVRYKALVPRSY